MTKVCSKWVPYLLSPLQRHEGVEACEELLARYEEEGNDFVSRIITDASHGSITINLNQNDHLNNENELTLHH